MFSVSFDDINWDPSVPANDAEVFSKTTAPPPDLDFVNDFGAFIDTEFSFPEDDFSGENRSKRTRTEDPTPFFKSPFKASSSQNVAVNPMSNPFDLDDLLGTQGSAHNTISTGNVALIPNESFDTVSTEEQLSSDDLYDSETTSEYSCDDPLLEESKWAPKARGVMGGKMNPNLACSNEWANFDFDDVHDIFDETISRGRTTKGIKQKKSYAKQPSSKSSSTKRSRKESEDDGDTTNVRRRRKRKVDMEQLRTRIANLIARKSDLSEQVDEGTRAALLKEELSVREAILGSFFHYRSTNMLDKTKWGELVTEDFSMTLPRTLYRVQRDDVLLPIPRVSSIGLESSSNPKESSPTKLQSDKLADANTTRTNLLSNMVPDVRNVFGIDALVSDTSSIHGMVEVIRSRVRAQRPELARKRAAGFALNLFIDDHSLKLDNSSQSGETFKATWRMVTHGLLSAGFSSECAVKGDAIMKFDSNYKLLSLVLDFDAISFGNQLQNHQLLDPTHLARQSLSLGLMGSAINGAKIAIGARGAGGVLAPAPLPVGSRPSAAFMRSFGQACAAVKQATEAANGSSNSSGASSSSPPSAHRVMQMMALNMQMMQAGGAGGVLLPGGAGAAPTKKSKSPSLESNEKSPSATCVPLTNAKATATSSSSVAPTSSGVAASMSVSASSSLNKQGKKRPASAVVTEVGTAAAANSSFNLFNLSRPLTNTKGTTSSSNVTKQVPPVSSSPASSLPMPKVQPSSQPCHKDATRNTNLDMSLSQTMPMFNSSTQQQKQPSALLPSHLQQGASHPTLSMPPFPFHNMPGFPQMNQTLASCNNTSSNSNGQPSPFSHTGPSNSESILSLFPYGLPSPSAMSGGGTSNSPNPVPLSAAQLSQMFGLMQNNAAFQQVFNQSAPSNGSATKTNTPSSAHNPFLGSYFPSHLSSNNTTFPSHLSPLTLSNEHGLGFCPPPALPNLARTNPN